MTKLQKELEQLENKGQEFLKTLYDKGGLLCDSAIKALIKIEPFADKSPPGVISYGLTSYGYDMRVGYKFKVFTNCYGAVVDPKGIHASAFVDIDLTPAEHAWQRPDKNESPDYWYCHKCDRYGHWYKPPASKDVPCQVKPDHVIVPPNSFALAGSVEKFTIPRNVLAICLGKSTLARCGIIVNVTPLEPEWEGYVTVEISNTTPLPCKIYANEGISQVLFFAAPVECQVSYADKKGKYQGQTGLTLPKV